MKLATSVGANGRADSPAGGRRWRSGLRRFAVAAVSLALPAFGLAAERASAASGDCTGTLEVTCTFSYTGGAQTWSPPAGITQATFTLYGAQGGSAYGFGGAGGVGAKVTATVAVNSELAYEINVGGAGDFGAPGAFGGGGIGSGYTDGVTSGGAGGGGASDVHAGALPGFPRDTRMLVAGGGGGGGNLGQRGTLPGGRGGDAGSAAAQAAGPTIGSGGR